jgi:CubicO group peptidase (beta-lactamase class C family)
MVRQDRGICPLGTASSMLISKTAFYGNYYETMTYKMKSIFIKVTFLLSFLLLLQAAFGQDWNQLDAELKTRQRALGDNVVMLVWKNDTLAFKRELGDFNSKTQAPIASCSKWLTAALVMMFVDEGKISLDEKVGKFVPELDRYGKSYITFRHCLSHLTGIEDEGKFLKKLFQRKKYSSLEEEVNSFAAREIRSNAGQDFWYGNIGLNIAGRALEVISKKRFDVLIKQKLFNPLAMRRTTFTTLDNSAVNPSGGASSTPDDYMQFLVMLLNKGQYKGKKILSEESVNEMMKVMTNPSMIKYAPEVAQGYNYALGAWVLEEKDGKATALASPGLFGTWPVVDFCRKYAYLVFVKNLITEERAEVQKELLGFINKDIQTSCP